MTVARVMPSGHDPASGVLTTPELRDTDTSGLGVLAVFRCEKIANGDYSNLSPAVGVR